MVSELYENKNYVLSDESIEIIASTLLPDIQEYISHKENRERFEKWKNDNEEHDNK